MAKVTAKKSAKKNAHKTAKKSAAKKVAPKLAAKKTPVKKVVVKKAIVKKTAVKKTVAKKSVKKVSAKKTTAPIFTVKKGGGLPEQLLAATLKILDERKADNIKTIDLAGKSAIADYVVVASGQAARQIAAIAHYLQDAYYKLGIRDVRMEGMREGNWVLVDCGDVIVHLFRPEVREYYDLESLWTRSPSSRPSRSRA